jgi:hypothetical protein
MSSGYLFMIVQKIAKVLEKKVTLQMHQKLVRKIESRIQNNYFGKHNIDLKSCSNEERELFFKMLPYLEITQYNKFLKALLPFLYLEGYLSWAVAWGVLRVENSHPEAMDVLSQKYVQGSDLWIVKGKVEYGRSFLLGGLLQRLKNEDSLELKAAVETVLDRIILAIEIKKNEAFSFYEGKEINNSDVNSEYLRYILNLLEASEYFRDIRYLNAAMKALDRMYWEARHCLHKPSFGVRELDFIMLSLYLSCFYEQEQQLERWIRGEC